MLRNVCRTSSSADRLVRMPDGREAQQASAGLVSHRVVRLIVALCSVAYSTRLSVRLPEGATPHNKSDGWVLVHVDCGGYKPLKRRS